MRDISLILIALTVLACVFVAIFVYAVTIWRERRDLDSALEAVAGLAVVIVTCFVIADTVRSLIALGVTP